MRTDRSLTRSRHVRSSLPAVLGTVLVCLLVLVSRADDPPRMKRADAFLGIHFDFHAGDDCDRVGARTTRGMVELVIDKVNPDYIQIDCKGHRGYSSYPAKVGNRARRSFDMRKRRLFERLDSVELEALEKLAALVGKAERN